MDIEKIAGAATRSVGATQLTKEQQKVRGTEGFGCQAKLYLENPGEFDHFNGMFIKQGTIFFSNVDSSCFFFFKCFFCRIHF